MQTTFLAIAAAASIISTTSAAPFNPTTDSCVPAIDAFRGAASPDFVPCPLSSGSQYVLRYDCGDRGYVYHSYMSNTIRLVNKVSNTNGEFTIHGACLENGSQVAHVDLNMPTKAGIVFDKTYHGLNRVCNVFEPTYRVLEVASYTLETKQRGECAKHPIKPKTST